jgi:hypothetical protein
MSVTMIAITGKGSLLRYGTREWYSDALFEASRKNDDLPYGSLITIGEGREVAIARKVPLGSNASDTRKKSNEKERRRRWNASAAAE